MSKPNIQLTKTCSSCGLQKPISAFLEMAGQLGARYGNICSSCRKTNADKKAQPKETEDSTTNVSGSRIDADAKYHGDRAKLEYKETIDKLYHEERDEVEEQKIEKDLKGEKTEKDEKRHRFEKKSSSSLWGAKKETIATKPNETREAAQARIAAEQGIMHAQTAETTQRQEQAGKDQQKLDALDFSAGAPFIASQTGEGKFKTAEFNKVKAWFGFNAPIISQAERVAMLNAKQGTSEIKQPSAAGSKAEVSENVAKETPSEHIKNRWKR